MTKLYPIFAVALLSLAPTLSYAQAPMPKHDGGTVLAAPVEVLSEWPPGTFLESIAVLADGTVLIANHDNGTLERIGTSGGPRTTVGKLPGLITGIELAADDTVLATGRVKGGPETIYRIDMKGAVSEVATVPNAKFLNGLTRIAPAVVLIADSAASSIWQLDLSTSTVTPWLRHELVGPKDVASEFPKNTSFPAANGIKRFGDAIFVSNSDRAAVIRIPLMQGNTAGTPTVIAIDILVDDFAFDIDGAIYATSHPMNSVVKIAPDGKRTTISTCSSGSAGPTAAAFGATGADRSRLFVVGNSNIPCDGKAAPARLIRLEVGREGHRQSF